MKDVVGEGIMPYTDSGGNEYVRVKMDGEDFCIAARDYTEGEKEYFTWNEAIQIMDDIGAVLPTKNQMELCIKHLSWVNHKLNEIGGNTFNRDWYWTSTEYDTDAKRAWFYKGEHEEVGNGYKFDTLRVRPVLNMK